VQTVSFAAGPAAHGCERALAYARIRHGSSDFQRAERQQHVYRGVLARLLNPLAWPRLPLVAAAIGQSVDSDVSFCRPGAPGATLFWVGPADWIARVIEGDMVEPYTTDRGADVPAARWDTSIRAAGGCLA